MAKKSQRWKKGAILEINAYGHLCRAQMLRFPELAFFDPLQSNKLLFRLWGQQSAIYDGRWQKVGKDPVTVELTSEIPRFKKDAITGKISFYISGSERTASLEECEGLECAAVWEPEQVEDRLRDHCENKENKWVKSMAL
ncbi:hypothetical protein GCM10007891_09680 [Methylophaga thalassica]|uniref:Uncharacterized protein n=1 Tax=Methylophaga thalassica TaxID=40223 RepID=A0ABQ5TT21_9GAMM|nr:hypothetical protein [Methylophaga thalassica]GLP99114.1 hypothetical protein GCM10007891_09680 [Methylophaga thalassica]